MDEIVAVCVYKEITGLTGDRDDKKREIFDPYAKNPAKKAEPVPEDPVQEKVSFSCDAVEGEDLETSFDDTVSLIHGRIYFCICSWNHILRAQSWEAISNFHQ